MSAPVSPTSAADSAADRAPGEPVGPSAAPEPRRGVHHLALRACIKVVVTVVGAAVTLLGVALLVLPGPGFLLIAGGLAIMATQFPRLRGPLRRAKVVAQRGVDEVAEKWWRTAVAVGTGVGMVGLGVLPFTGVQIDYLTRTGGTFPSTDVEVPHLTSLSGAMIGAGGLFLVGLVVYARRTGGLVHPDGELPDVAPSSSGAAPGTPPRTPTRTSAG